MKTLVTIVGPTGVGKTEVAITLAKALGCDILNADSRQIYRGLTIGTASPTAAQMAEAQHHFVGILDINDYYSAARFETDSLNLLSALSTEHAILSGGSMLYVDAVTEGIDDIPSVSAEVRTWMRGRLQAEGLDALRQELRLLDPAYYATVDLKNTRRIVHALEICHQSGKPYSTFRIRSAKARPFRVIKLGLRRERAELFARINRRVDQMVADGLLDETRLMLPHRDSNALNTVGYKEMLNVLDGTWSLDFATERMKKNTRVYAKKQMTWWARDPEIHWFHPDETTAMLRHIYNTESNITDHEDGIR